MSWILAFAGFAALIILHEFGHFIAAKWTGMRVERFFLFFPPKLWSIKRGETEYGVGWLPLGGFVKITGMNPDEVDPPPSDPDARDVGFLERVESVDQEAGEGVSRPGEPLSPELRERAYYNQPVWKRIVVIAAGPAMNLLVAFVIFFALFMTAERATQLEVGEIEDDSPAQGKLQDGDRFIAVDGVRPTDDQVGDRADALAAQINTHECEGEAVDGCTASTPARITVERNGEEVVVEATPYYDADAPPIEEGDDAGRYRLGFQFQPSGLVPVNPSVPEALGDSASQMWRITKLTAEIPARLLNAEQRKEISGVVGSYETTRQTIKIDWELALGVLGIISLSLAIINLFPFLPLDGGHIFWSVVEKVRGRRVPFAVMERSGVIGFILIIMLAFIGLSNDLDRIVSGEGFGISDR
ncbi:MAG: peptidase M50 [Actinobacteria bacterium]|nr:peptidase M50 [Actinomycetota bacterium]